MKSLFNLLFFILVSQLSVNAAEVPPFQEPIENFEFFSEPQNRQEPSNFQEKFLKMVYILAFLLAGMIAVLWFVKKITQPGSPLSVSNKTKKKALEIIEVRPLSTKSTLYLVAVNGKEVIVAESNGAISMIEAPNALENKLD